MKSIANGSKLVIRDDPTWERTVFAEVLIPDTPNVFNDYWTVEAVKEAAYLFMRQGYGIDIEHDKVNVLGDKAYVCESFIVRPGDPDFLEGSWVIAMHILDDVLWQDILDNKINGFSYQAVVQMQSALLEMADDGIRTGVTEPDLYDGHVHTFMVMVDDTNRPTGGGTSTENGHSHVISSHTVTQEAAGHSHRYNLVTGKEGK